MTAKHKLVVAHDVQRVYIGTLSVDAALAGNSQKLFHDLTFLPLALGAGLVYDIIVSLIIHIAICNIAQKCDVCFVYFD